MPFIMDQDLDDLFGEGPPLQLPEPIPRGLPQRVDELSLSGCRQYVSDPHKGGDFLKSDQKSGLV